MKCSHCPQQSLTTARLILKGLGGTENILSLDHCLTRLRIVLRDSSNIDEKMIQTAGAAGIIRTDTDGIQIVIGTTVAFVATAMKDLLSEYF